MSEAPTFCLVCGDKSSGRHYGVLTCDGCRGFFKRSVRRGMGYACREKSKCVVDLNRRNQCQACRMKKCLTVGMKKEAVQHERAPRLLKNRVHQFSPYPRVVDYSSIAEATTNNQSNEGRTTLPPSPPHTPKESIEITSPDELYDISIRLLYEAIIWSRNIPPFGKLSLQDQALMLERSWPGLFLLNLAQWNVPIDLDHLLHIGAIAKEQRTEKKPVEPVKQEDSEIIGNLIHLKSTVQKFKIFDLDPTEFSCLKAILLFNPDLPALTGQCQVEKLQDQAHIMLQDYITRKNSKNGRFGKILLKLPLLIEISSTLVKDYMFKGTLGNIRQEKLLSTNITVEHERTNAINRNDENNNNNNNSSNNTQIDNTLLTGIEEEKIETRQTLQFDDEIEIDIIKIEVEE